MAGTITAKDARIFAITIPILPATALGSWRVVYRCDTPDGVVEIAYDRPLYQGDDLTTAVPLVEAEFKADVTALGYSFT